MSGVCCHSANSILWLTKKELHQLGLFAYCPCPSPAPHWHTQCSWPQFSSHLCPTKSKWILWGVLYNRRQINEGWGRESTEPRFFSIPQSQSVTDLLSALILLLSAGCNKRAHSRDLKQCTAILDVRLNKNYLAYLPLKVQSKELWCC